MGYGVCSTIYCKPNWLQPKSMGYDKVWLLTAMAYDRVDCIKTSYRKGKDLPSRCDAYIRDLNTYKFPISRRGEGNGVTSKIVACISRSDRAYEA